MGQNKTRTHEFDELVEMKTTQRTKTRGQCQFIAICMYFDIWIQISSNPPFFLGPAIN